MLYYKLLISCLLVCVWPGGWEDEQNADLRRKRPCLQGEFKKIAVNRAGCNQHWA